MTETIILCHCGLHRSCGFGGSCLENWEASVRSHSLLHPCCCYLYLHPSDCRAELGCICHRYYRESPIPAGPGGCGQFTGCEELSQAMTLKSTARNPSCWIQWRPSNLSSFMYKLPGCPTTGGGETLVPPHRNLGGIIPSELFIVHEDDIF